MTEAFVTQTPRNVPAEVLGQLGNRVQHALRAFTSDDQRALRATVKAFPNSAYDLEDLLTGLGTGEAVVTVLSEKGAPPPVAATRLRAPESLMGPVETGALERAVTESALYGRYAQAKQSAAHQAGQAGRNHHLSRPPVQRRPRRFEGVFVRVVPGQGAASTNCNAANLGEQAPKRRSTQPSARRYLRTARVRKITTITIE